MNYDSCPICNRTLCQAEDAKSYLYICGNCRLYSRINYKDFPQNNFIIDGHTFVSTCGPSPEEQMENSAMMEKAVVKARREYFKSKLNKVYFRQYETAE